MGQQGHFVHEWVFFLQKFLVSMQWGKSESLLVRPPPFNPEGKGRGRGAQLAPQVARAERRAPRDKD